MPDLKNQLTHWSHHRQLLEKQGNDFEQILNDIIGVYSAHPSAALSLFARIKAFNKKAFYDLDEKKIAFYVGDVSNLPYRDQVLDAIFGFGVLHHVPDWQKALAEISRVMKFSGFYFMEERYPSLYQNFITKHILLHPRRNRFRSLDLKEAVKARNLHIVKLLEHSRNT